MTRLQENTATNFEVSPHILVMEDDLSVAKGLEMVLSEEGYTVNLAGTGELAMEAFGQKRFDLLVADLRLPDIDGMEVIKQVKDTKPETEVIVITGYGTTATAVEAMKLGVHDFLPKPFTEDQIKSAIDEALKEHVEKSAEAVIQKAETAEEKLIQKREVLGVLSRTAEDLDFWRDLMENGSLALADYKLSGEAKAAIASGDLKWINENVGELTQKQLMFIYKRLEREAW
ncbi:MAG: response regulator [Desulfobacteraceae bacterium]|jgi:ActR/RegA family two-component response regulator|nr:response regulator [Desulfobacteraceae bacterium]